MPGVKTATWYDDDLKVVKTSVVMMGMKMETYQASMERAQNGPREEMRPDLIMKSAAHSNVNLPNPYRLDSIVYRFKVKDAVLGIPKGLDDVRPWSNRSRSTATRPS